MLRAERARDVVDPAKAGSYSVCGAEDGDRTRTLIAEHGILSPGRLPVPPLRPVPLKLQPSPPFPKPPTKTWGQKSWGKVRDTHD